jgi:hypothetical protein
LNSIALKLGMRFAVNIKSASRAGQPATQAP